MDRIWRSFSSTLAGEGIGGSRERQTLEFRPHNTGKYTARDLPATLFLFSPPCRHFLPIVACLLPPYYLLRLPDRLLSLHAFASVR